MACFRLADLSSAEDDLVGLSPQFNDVNLAEGENLATIIQVAEGGEYWENSLCK